MQAINNLYQVRDISSDYGYPAFDVVYTDPKTWKCYYGENDYFVCAEDAQARADELNIGGNVCAAFVAVNMED